MEREPCVVFGCAVTVTGCVTARTNTVRVCGLIPVVMVTGRAGHASFLPYSTAFHRFESMTAEPSHNPTIAEVSDKFRPAARYIESGAGKLPRDIPESYLFSPVLATCTCINVTSRFYSKLQKEYI